MANIEPNEVELIVQTLPIRAVNDALLDAARLRIKSKAVEQFPLNVNERTLLATFPPYAADMKKLEDGVSWTFSEVATKVLGTSLLSLRAAPQHRDVLLAISRKLLDCLQQNIKTAELARAAKKTKGSKARKASKLSSEDTVYQFKITLGHSQPPIWRRIQTKNCTLSTFHDYIQAVMGWDDQHMHVFRLGRRFFGDPEYLDDAEDSMTVTIRDILPEGGRKFRFQYEYDFGDSWDHEILFEKIVKADPQQVYPLCLEGARACPPEDVGGMWDYSEFVEAIQNPEHERHAEQLEWIGCDFDPEAFDPEQATKAMRRQRTTGEASEVKSDEE